MGSGATEYRVARCSPCVPSGVPPQTQSRAVWRSPSLNLIENACLTLNFNVIVLLCQYVNAFQGSWGERDNMKWTREPACPVVRSFATEKDFQNSLHRVGASLQKNTVW